jgi:GntR family transcriptional repressor for pyruvate dehydrogenase complex
MSLAVTKKTLGELVASRIRDYILDQGMKTGDRLPTEQQFAEMFGVSRVVVREATKSLGYLGIIRAAPRRGLTVGIMDNERLAEIISFNWMLGSMDPVIMFRTWSILIAGALSISGHTIPPADMAELTTLAAKADADGTLSQAETDFNRKLLLVCGSTGVSFFGTTIVQYLRTFQEKNKKKFTSKSGPIYRQVVELLKNKQPAEAEALLLSHITTLSF